MEKKAKPRIMIVDDEEHVLTFMSRALEKKAYETHPARTAEEALQQFAKVDPTLVISDIVLPDRNGTELLDEIKKRDPECNVILITAHASLDTAISAIRGGAFDYLVKPFKLEELCSVVKRALSSKRLLHPASDSQTSQAKRSDLRSLVGSSAKLQEVQKLIEKVSPTEVTVLITGESGTGKELVARAIHLGSMRREKPFVSINCAALPEALLESELFGYEKGSFTGALTSKPGLLELADGGTFFFDEIGEIPPPVQAKLLRVIQEREVRHVGGLRDLKVDIRIVAATSKELQVEVDQARFREDLYYRLNVVPIHMPPLRERRDDIPLLLEHFLTFLSQKHGITKSLAIEPEALNYLTHEYTWPGNVRELENFLERCLMMSENGRITLAQVLSLKEREPSRLTSGVQVPTATRNLRVETEEFEKCLIQSVLQETQGNKFRAARRLQISRQSLQYKIKKYQLE